ncbi:hypothetical protein [Streptomyces humidus]|uniref:hypothetical protein n=1 Tax=Streptomyces humidus TaxID=52259 RepID=UPI00332C15CC
MPRSTKASELPQLAHSHDVAELRGVVDEEHRIVVIPEENLLGEATTALGGERHYADGYSVVTHETAHAVYLFGLDERQQAVVHDAYTMRMRRDPSVEWADGPRLDTDNKVVDNYASRDVLEYFAQTSNAYLGTNHGVDPYTGRARNNGAEWVRNTESDRMVTLLESLYGTTPQDLSANPVTQTRTENDLWQGLRDFTHLTQPTDTDTQTDTDSAPGPRELDPSEDLFHTVMQQLHRIREDLTSDRATVEETHRRLLRERSVLPGMSRVQVAGRIADDIASESGVEPARLRAGMLKTQVLAQDEAGAGGHAAGSSQQGSATAGTSRAADSGTASAPPRRTPEEPRRTSEEPRNTPEDSLEPSPEPPGAPVADPAARERAALREAWGGELAARSYQKEKATRLGAKTGSPLEAWELWESTARDFAESGRTMGAGALDRATREMVAWGMAPGPRQYQRRDAFERAWRQQRAAAVPAPPAERHGRAATVVPPGVGALPAMPPSDPEVPQPDQEAQDKQEVPAEAPTADDAHGGAPGVSSSGGAGLTKSGPSADASPALPLIVVSDTEVSGTVRDFGSADRRGAPGLVSVSPLAPWTVTALHHQIVRALGAAADEGSVTAAVNGALSQEQLAEHMPALLSTEGHRVTVTSDGRERDLRIRLALEYDGRPEWYGESGAGRPQHRVERRALSTHSTSNRGSYHTSRSIPFGWTGIFPVPGEVPLLRVIGSAQVNVTHNQMSSSTQVGSSVRTLSNLSSSEPSEPYSYRVTWQVREHTGTPTAGAEEPPRLTVAPADRPEAGGDAIGPGDTERADGSGWRTSEQAGTVTVWFPQHLASDDHLAPDGAEPAALDDLPLWNVDSLADPERLSDEVRRQFASVLSLLAPESRAEAEALFSEPRLRGAMPLLRHGAFSPLLWDTDGNAIGMFRLTADVKVGEALRSSVPGGTMLESHVGHGRSVAGSAQLSSGVAGEVAVSAALGSGTVPTGGTSAAAGTLTVRGGGSAHLTKTLGSGGSASLRHSLLSTAAHLLTSADVTYTVEFVRDGSALRHEFGTWEEGLRLRILGDEDARGTEPAQSRSLPPELEQMRSIGLSATVLEVSGAEGLFATAENHLRQQGFLPPPAETREADGAVQEVAAPRLPLGRPGAAARLENLRRFELARNHVGLRAVADGAVDGGYAVWLDDPLAVPARRVQLRLTITRDHGEPSRHTRTLPQVSTFNTAAQNDPGTQEEGSDRGLHVGLGPSGGGSTGGRGAFLTGGVDYRHDWQWGTAEETSNEVAHDQSTWGESQPSEVFDVPVVVRLALYGEDPLTPIAEFRPEPPDDRQEPAAVDGAHALTSSAGAPPAATGTDDQAGERGGQPGHGRPQRSGPGTDGTLRVAVPRHRTLAEPEPSAAEAAPVVLPRAATQDDHDSLALVGPDGTPRENVIRVPGDAVIDVFAGSRELISAFESVIGGTYAEAQEAAVAEGAGRGKTASAGDRLTAMMPTGLARAGGSAVRSLVGDAPGDQRSFMSETLRAALGPEQLVARGHQILGGGYVVEGLALPGALADGEYSVELRGYAHRPRSVVSAAQYQETGVSSGDGASHTRKHSSGSTVTVGFGGRRDVKDRPAPGAPVGSTNSMVTPVLSYATQRRTARSLTEGSSGEFARTLTEENRQHRLRSTVTVLMTVRRGHRNIATGLVGRGKGPVVTIALDLPRSLDVLVTDEQIRRNATWFAGVPELSDIVDSAGPVDDAPRPALPDWFARTGDLGTGVVLDSLALAEHQPDDGSGRENQGPDVRSPAPAETPAQGHPFQEKLLAQVEKEAPGAMRPGNSSYVPGLRSRIVAATGQAAMRALPARGSKGVRRFRFLYSAAGGTRLVEVELRARPRDDVQGLRAVRGRTAGEGAGLETVSSVAPSNESRGSSWSSSHQASLGLITRHPRAGNHMVGDLTGPTLGTAIGHSRSVTRSTAWQDRSWTETEHTAEFDVVYTYTTSVRSAPVGAWPPDLLGGYVSSGLVSWSDTPDLRSWLAATFAGRTPRPQATTVRNTLRFVAGEAPAQPVAGADPVPFHRPATHPIGTTDASALPLTPAGPVIVHGFDGAHHLRDALAEAHPGLPGQGLMEALDSRENAAARLGELIESRTARIGPGQTLRMPGAWPDTGITTVTTELFHPRPVTVADDVALARGLLNASSQSSAGSVSIAPSMSWSTTLPMDPRNETQRFAVGAAMISPDALRSAQTAGTGDAHRERLKAAAVSTTPEGTSGTRTHETAVDVLITVDGGDDGPRYVYGTTTVRLAESDLLGHGVTEARVQPRVYDLRSLLRDQPDEALREWTRHPLADLPGALAAGLHEDDPAVQLWLATRSATASPEESGPTPLGRALYAAAQTALLARRPVELFLRTERGTHRWHFDATGRLHTQDARVRDAWDDFAAPMSDHAEAAERQTRLRAAERALDEALGAARTRVEQSGAALLRAGAAYDASLDDQVSAVASHGEQELPERLRTAEEQTAVHAERTAAARRTYAEAATEAERLAGQITELVRGQRDEAVAQTAALRRLTIAAHDLETAREASGEGRAGTPAASLTMRTTRRRADIGAPSAPESLTTEPPVPSVAKPRAPRPAAQERPAAREPAGTVAEEAAAPATHAPGGASARMSTGDSPPRRPGESAELDSGAEDAPEPVTPRADADAAVDARDRRQQARAALNRAPVELRTQERAAAGRPASALEAAERAVSQAEWDVETAEADLRELGYDGPDLAGHLREGDPRFPGAGAGRRPGAEGRPSAAGSGAGSASRPEDFVAPSPPVTAGSPVPGGVAFTGTSSAGTSDAPFPALPSHAARNEAVAPGGPVVGEPGRLVDGEPSAAGLTVAVPPGPEPMATWDAGSERHASADEHVLAVPSRVSGGTVFTSPQDAVPEPAVTDGGEFEGVEPVTVSFAEASRTVDGEQQRELRNLARRLARQAVRNRELGLAQQAVRIRGRGNSSGHAAFTGRTRAKNTAHALEDHLAVELRALQGAVADPVVVRDLDIRYGYEDTLGQNRMDPANRRTAIVSVGEDSLPEGVTWTPLREPDSRDRHELAETPLTVTFGRGGKEVSEKDSRRIEDLAERIAVRALRNRRSGLRPPAVRITGRGNGRRAEANGTERAANTDAQLRQFLARRLLELQPGVEVPLTLDDFPITTVFDDAPKALYQDPLTHRTATIALDWPAEGPASEAPGPEAEEETRAGSVFEFGPEPEQEPDPEEPQEPQESQKPEEEKALPPLPFAAAAYGADSEAAREDSAVLGVAAARGATAPGTTNYRRVGPDTLLGPDGAVLELRPASGPGSGLTEAVMEIVRADVGEAGDWYRPGGTPDQAIAELHRAALAAELTEEDLPDSPLSSPRDLLRTTVDELRLAGVPLTEERLARAEAGEGALDIASAELTPVQLTRLLLLRPETWNPVIDRIAAAGLARTFMLDLTVVDLDARDEAHIGQGPTRGVIVLEDGRFRAAVPDRKTSTTTDQSPTQL